MRRISVSIAIALACSTSRTIAQQATLTGGGEVSLRRDGDILIVSVVGPRPGLASLCLAHASRVRILHASAAIGEAQYERSGGYWGLVRGFEWQLRDSPDTGGPNPKQVEEFLKRSGWVANASNTGSPRRTFKIRLSHGTQFLGVTYLSTSEPMAVSFWPSTLADDCKLETIGQGHLPKSATFHPESWHRLSTMHKR